MKKDNISEAAILRQKAEEILKKNSSKSASRLSEAEAMKLIHELEVHQIVLEMQNAELELAGSAAQVAADKYIELYDFAPLGYFTLSKEGEIIDLNLFGSQMLGKERSGLKNKLFGSLISADTKPVFYHFLKRVFDNNSKETCEVTLSINGNFSRFVNLIGRVTENGEQCIVNVVDVTEQKLAEESVAAIALRNKILLQTASDGIHVIDDQGHVAEANAAFCTMLGYTREELLQLNVADWDMQWSGEELLSKVSELISNPAMFETQHRRKDGTLLDVEINAVSVTLEGHNYLYASARDITGRKALRESEVELNVILQSTADGILAIDSNGKVIKTNERFTKLWRIPQFLIDSGEDKALLDFVLEQLIEPEQFISKVKMLYNSTDEDLDILHFKDGRIFERFSSPLRLSDSSIGRVWSFRDITDSKLTEEALIKSETRFRSILNASPVPMALNDEQQHITFLNPAFVQTFGYAREDIPTLADWWVKAYPDPVYRQRVADTWQAGLEQAKQTGQAFSSGEITVNCKDGTSKTVLTSAASFSNSFEGNHLVVLYDITDRKQAEKALLESEAEYKVLSKQLEAILDHIPGLVFYKDTKNNFIRVNKYVAHAHGKEKEELEGKNLSDLYPEKDATNYYQDDLAVINSGIAKLNIEEPWETASGLKWVSTSKIPFVGDNGEYIGIIGMSMDITERKRVEEELVREQYLLLTLMDNLPDHIYFKDLESRFVRINKSHSLLFGLDNPEQAIGKTDFDFFSGEHSQQAFDDEQKIIWTGQSLSIEEKETYHDDRPDAWVSTVKMPLYNKEGKIIGTFGISRDVTKQQSAQQEIKLKNEELQKVNAEKDKFFSIIAHDLRSPLSSFLGYTQMMVEDLPTMELADLQEMAVSMEKSATNLYRLLENLLEWAKMQQGLVPFNPGVVQLISIVNESMEMLIESAKNKGIEITYDIPVGIRVIADTNMLQTIIRNFISNAVKFTSKGGKISISAKASGDKSIEISIQDSGIGMSPAMVNNLFQLNAQINRKGTEGEPSSGLGLLLCKEFIEKHGGKFWVESEEGKGSTFYFTLA